MQLNMPLLGNKKNSQLFRTAIIGREIQCRKVTMLALERTKKIVENARKVGEKHNYGFREPKINSLQPQDESKCYEISLFHISNCCFRFATRGAF